MTETQWCNTLSWWMCRRAEGWNFGEFCHSENLDKEEAEKKAEEYGFTTEPYL